MHSDADKYLKQIRDLILANIGQRQVRVYLFGSRAIGKETPGSDVDVAIEGEGPLDPGLLFRIRDALEESTIPYKVDVIDLSRVPPELQQYVHRTGILWKDWN